MRRGYIQVYTGNGKGKTTAALGLALRAAGAGLRVFIAQFVKQRRCSEHKALERFSDLITIRRCGKGFLRGKSPVKPDFESAEKGYREAKDIIASGQYDVVILDEINVALHYGLLDIEDLLRVMENKPAGLELVLTGRYADERIIAKADLVTEMKDIKHYSVSGVKARTGIEC
ncbi:MAG: cob(I)yrinic acid a,c-diamide adenosyltransferase [Nitrospirae bacterium]|nr:cob(I)yrinic acid a,c-diamide adenosyltransferase [Nitrospirota bacterium]